MLDKIKVNPRKSHKPFENKFVNCIKKPIFNEKPREPDNQNIKENNASKLKTKVKIS